MRPGAHIKAAIEVLDEVLGRHRPAATALADWGKSHRFAGSGDRAAIGNLVYDALRRRRSLAAQMGADTTARDRPGAAPQALGLSPAAVIASADGSPHAVEPLSEAEQAALTRALPADAPLSVRGDFPDWLEPSFDARLRRGCGRGRRGAGPSGPGRPAGQHAQGRPRQGAEGAGAVRTRSRRRCRRSACGCRRRTVRAGSPMSRPRSGTGAAGTRCRTRARRSPR